ncbi:AAA family ATPase [Streptomyces sp. NPDC101062]|uniref:AAA family ATPase n=1 Tax=unclassified Streptomyces TaxID=2593676 RepID=UPI00381BDE77
MTTEAILFLVTAVILPMALTELGDWCPRLAKHLVGWTARRLGDPQAIERYSEEWTAELEELPGKLAHMGFALGYLARLPLLRWSLRTARRASRPGQPLEQLLPTRTPNSLNYGLTVLPSADQRQACFTLLDAILDVSPSSRNRMHLLMGPAGCGKSMTVRWVGEALARAGAKMHYVWAPDWATQRRPLHVSPQLRDRLTQATQGLGLLVVDEADETTVEVLEALRLPCSVLVVKRDTGVLGAAADLTRRPPILGAVVDMGPAFVMAGYAQRSPGVPNPLPPVNGQF